MLGCCIRCLFLPSTALSSAESFWARNAGVGAALTWEGCRWASHSLVSQGELVPFALCTGKPEKYIFFGQRISKQSYKGYICVFLVKQTKVQDLSACLLAQIKGFEHLRSLSMNGTLFLALFCLQAIEAPALFPYCNYSLFIMVIIY